MCTPVSQEKARDGGEEVVGNGHGDDGRVLLPPPGDEAIVHWGIIQMSYITYSLRNVNTMLLLWCVNYIHVGYF